MKSPRVAIERRGAGVDAAAGEKVAVGAEHGDGGDLRQADSHVVERVIQLLLVRSDYRVVFLAQQAGHAGRHLAVQVEHLDRLFIGDASETIDYFRRIREAALIADAAICRDKQERSNNGSQQDNDE